MADSRASDMCFSAPQTRFASRQATQAQIRDHGREAGHQNPEGPAPKKVMI